MRSSTRCIVLATVTGALLVPLAACESTPPSSEAQPAAGVSPVSERDARRQAEWARAVDGLDFDSGVVVVQSPPGRSDVASARQLMQRGETELQVNHKIPAVEAFADAVKAAPDMIEPYMGLGRAMILKGKTDLAAVSYRTVIQLQPNHVEARVELANCLARELRHEEAIAEMQQVLVLDPTHAQAHERLAIWHYYVGDYGAAWRHVHAADDLGHVMPPQFINQLRGKMADPGAG